MTDRREGFPPTAASSSTPLHDGDSELLAAAKNAAAVIGAVYEWLERVEKAGGATSIEGVAACNSMLKSLRKNADLTEALVMVPLRAAIAKAKDSEPPSYQRSSEGTRAGGHQTPTQNERE